MDRQLFVLFPLASLLLLPGAYCQDPCGHSTEGYTKCISTVTQSSDHEAKYNCFTVFEHRVTVQKARENCHNCHRILIDWPQYPRGLKAELAHRLRRDQEYWIGWSRCPPETKGGHHCVKIVDDQRESHLECTKCSPGSSKPYVCSYNSASDASSSTTEPESDSSESSFIIPVAVGATLAVLLVLAVVAVIFLVLRRRKRHACQRSAGPSSFANTTCDIDNTFTSKPKHPTAPPEERTGVLAPEYSQLRKGKLSPGGSTQPDTDNDHHFVDNELYAGTRESHSPPDSLAVAGTREQDDVEEEGDKVLTLADNDLYG